MDILVVLALIVGASVCFLPGIMAWSYYSSGSRKAARKSKTVSLNKPVPTGNA